MHVHGTDQHTQELFTSIVSLSILYSRVLVISKPTDDMLTLLRQVTPLCKASLKGAGKGSSECIFMPGKIVRKTQLTLEGEDCVPLLKTILLPALFSGKQFTLELEEVVQVETSLYYLRDVLFAYLKPYITFIKLQSFPDGKVFFQTKGSRSLEDAPPFFLRDQQELVAIRGVVENYPHNLLEMMRLSLKEFSVPVNIEERHTSQGPVLHLHALYGTTEGYDSDFPSITYLDRIGEPSIDKDLEVFKEQIQARLTSSELLNDLLLITEIVGGTLGEIGEKQKVLQEQLAAICDELTT